jgi:AmmeMemoRadiSam system protein B
MLHRFLACSRTLPARLRRDEERRRRSRAQVRASRLRCPLTRVMHRLAPSLELHYPFIAQLFDAGVQLVPIMVGDMRQGALQQCAAALAPFFADAQNFFVISSDFCHWCFSHLTCLRRYVRQSLVRVQGRSFRLHSRRQVCRMCVFWHRIFSCFTMSCDVLFRRLLQRH